jgi:predicted metal-dependent hydrolase
MELQTETRVPPKPRSPGVALTGVPRHWFGGNMVATHVANGVNLLFPAGERFFVRSVKHYLDRIEDENLRARVRGFFGQEGRHAKEHDEFNRILEEQGYEVDRFLALYERIAYGIIEKVAPPPIRLSATAACEHFTAILAENALRMRFLDVADSRMRELLLWHAAEEIEHRDVAYDVLMAIDPRYSTRVIGLAIGSMCLAGFWVAGTMHLLEQERKRDGLSVIRKHLRDLRSHQKTFGKRKPVFVPGIREYLKRDFHPSKNDIDGLARDYLAAAGLA